MDKRNAVIKTIKSRWNDTDIIDVWNLVCDHNNDTDSQLQSMNDKFEDFAEGVISREGVFYLLNMIKNGNFNTRDDWWWVEKDRLYSTWDALSAIDMEDVADYLIDFGDAGVAEVDTDDLLDEFIGEHFEGNDDARDVAEELIREQSFDLLTDDWWDLEGAVKARLARVDEE